MPRFIVDYEEKECKAYPMLNEESRKKLLDQLRFAFKSFVFRRVAKVDFKGKEPKEIRVFSSDGKHSVYTPAAIGEFKKSDYDQFVEYRYSYFEVETQPVAIRKSAAKFKVDGKEFVVNDPYPGKVIYAKKEGYGALDLTEKMNFDWESIKNDIPPRPNDLICGILSKAPETKGEKGPVFTRWFTCSEQFQHLCALLYDQVDLTDEKSDENWRYFMNGNRLNTSTFRKFVLAYAQNGLEMPPELKESKYFRLRTEPTSVKWCHIYTALAMMAIWGDVPCGDNVPYNADTPESERMKEWDLPTAWLEMLFKKFDLTANVIEKLHKIWFQTLPPEATNSSSDGTGKQEVEAQVTEEAFPSLAKKGAPIISRAKRIYVKG